MIIMGIHERSCTVSEFYLNDVYSRPCHDIYICPQHFTPLINDVTCRHTNSNLEAIQMDGANVP